MYCTNNETYIRNPSYPPLRKGAVVQRLFVLFLGKFVKISLLDANRQTPKERGSRSNQIFFLFLVQVVDNSIKNVNNSSRISGNNGNDYTL